MYSWISLSFSFRFRMISRFFLAMSVAGCVLFRRLNPVLQHLPAALELLGIDRRQIALVARAGQGHLHERADQGGALHQLVAHQIAGKRRILRGELVDLLLLGEERSHALLLARVERGQLSLELALFELGYHPVEFLVPHEPFQHSRFGRVHQPQRLGAQGRHGDERIERERGHGQRTREQREVVRIRERELQQRRSRAELLGGDYGRFWQFRNSHDPDQYKFVMRSTPPDRPAGSRSLRVSLAALGRHAWSPKE